MFRHQVCRMHDETAAGDGPPSRQNRSAAPGMLWPRAGHPRYTRLCRRASSRSGIPHGARDTSAVQWLWRQRG